MMLIFLTEYEEEGNCLGGPLIVAPNWEEAEKQASHCNITIIGSLSESLVGPVIEKKERVLH